MRYIKGHRIPIAAFLVSSPWTLDVSFNKPSMVSTFASFLSSNASHMAAVVAVQGRMVSVRPCLKAAVEQLS